MRELVRLIGLLIVEAYEDAKAYLRKWWDKLKVEIDD